MKIDGFPYRSIWVDEDGWAVRIIDQTKLPWSLAILRLSTDGGDGGGDPHHARARRAADRRCCGLRSLPGAECRFVHGRDGA